MFQRILALSLLPMLSGCAAIGGGTIAPVTTPNALGDRTRSAPSPDFETKNGVVFVSSENADSIILFALKGTDLNPIGAIVVGVSDPVGMSVDAAGTLYVANYFNSSVSEYPKGK